MNLSIFIFFPRIYLATRKVYIMKTLALKGVEKSVTENLIGEKDKWTNKGNDKQEEADSLLVIPNICTKFQTPRKSSS